MNHQTSERIRECVKDVLSSTGKTCLWIIKLTAGISFAMTLLKMTGILTWISALVAPFCMYLGLPGEAALAFVPGLFVNNYSCIAVAATLNLDWRAMTILFTMQLCVHAIILETAVLRKTGVSPLRMVVVRTLSAFLLGLILNLILPGEPMTGTCAVTDSVQPSFWTSLGQWAVSTLKLCALMTLIIYSLNILQRILAEFGLMDRLSRLLKPVMLFFGLPVNTSFLWIVANVIGLGYGAAVMLDQIGRGNLSSRDVDLFDTHICISHSNLEDLLLFTAMGASCWVMLLSRWAMSLILVWERRLEFYIKDSLFGKKCNFAG